MIMNRLDRLFKEKDKDILNLYITAGFPKIDSTVELLDNCAQAGVDLVEVGMPYSDPLADGSTIQNSSARALQNGMNLQLLFDQIATFRSKNNSLPIVWMGYFNQIVQYGPDRFFRACKEHGIDGLIVPDLPMNYYEDRYEAILEELDLKITFLITPDTSEERILDADRLSTGFLYVISKSGVTGKANEVESEQENFLKKIGQKTLSRPALVGFGIHNKKTYDASSKYVNGGIIGSAFIRHIDENGTSRSSIQTFVEAIRGN